MALSEVQPAPPYPPLPLLEAATLAAHDLKAPVHAIQGFAKLLLRESAGQINAQQRQFLEVIASEAERLGAGVERLLATMRMESHPDAGPGAEPVLPVAAGLQTVVEQTTRRFHGAFAEKGVDLQSDCAPCPPVAVAEGALVAILENLLQNALAATPCGGSVTVVVGPLDAGTVRCTVADDGPGIPAFALDQVFDPYFRLPERGGPGGTGLGLSICRMLAAAHGGRVHVINRPVRGAAFILDAPAAAAGPDEVALAAPVGGLVSGPVGGPVGGSVGGPPEEWAPRSRCGECGQ